MKINDVIKKLQRYKTLFGYPIYPKKRLKRLRNSFGWYG
jgi:hypothetical protein